MWERCGNGLLTLKVVGLRSEPLPKERVVSPTNDEWEHLEAGDSPSIGTVAPDIVRPSCFFFLVPA